MSCEQTLDNININVNALITQVALLQTALDASNLKLNKLDYLVDSNNEILIPEPSFTTINNSVDSIDDKLSDIRFALYDVDDMSILSVIDDISINLGGNEKYSNSPYSILKTIALNVGLDSIETTDTVQGKLNILMNKNYSTDLSAVNTKLDSLQDDSTEFKTFINGED